jgi:hypothetical protein
MALVAARKLSPDTLARLQAFYGSEAMSVTTGKGESDPSNQRAQWVKSCLNESASIAERCLGRLFWHHDNKSTKLVNYRDFECLVGLMEFDEDGSSTLTRAQETALMMTSKALSHYEQEVLGQPSYTKYYGKRLVGTVFHSEELARYVINNPDRADDICHLIKHRGVVDAAVIEDMLSAAEHSAVISGVL